MIDAGVGLAADRLEMAVLRSIWHADHVVFELRTIDDLPVLLRLDRVAGRTVRVAVSIGWAADHENRVEQFIEVLRDELDVRIERSGDVSVW